MPGLSKIFGVRLCRRDTDISISSALSTKTSITSSDLSTSGSENSISIESWRDPSTFPSEGERLALLQSLCVLQAGPSNRFDSITHLMATLFNTPVALVSLSGSDTLWFDSVYGPFGSCLNRKGSFCDIALVSDEPEVVFLEDLSQDARFSSHPAVSGPPYLKFYGGAPLVGSTGMRYGTLCVLDTKPRSFPPSLLNTLINFAELVTRELEMGDEISKVPSKLKQLGPLVRSSASFEEPVALVDLDKEGWPLHYCNKAWQAKLHLVDTNIKFWDLFEPVNQISMTKELQNLSELQQMRPTKLTVKRKGPFSEMVGCVQVVLRPAGDTLNAAVPVGIPFAGAQQHLAPSTVEKSLWFATLRLLPRNRNSNKTLSNSHKYEDSSSEHVMSISGHSEAMTESVCGNNSYTNEERGDTDDTDDGLDLVEASPMELLPHQFLLPDKYLDMQIGPLLGTGAFARVHRALWQSKQVAVKLIELPCNESSWKDVEDAYWEASLGSNLTHANIVKTLDFTRWRRAIQPDSHNSQAALEEIDCVWIVQELCDHGKLADAIDRGWFRQSPTMTAPINLTIYLKTAIDIANALTFLHAHSIIHGDLTYNNILLTSDPNDAERGWKAKVGDFGLSTIIQPNTSEVPSNNHYGTVSHQPMELLRDGIMGKYTDMYSFGVVLWEMWTGCRAFCGQRPAQIVLTVTEGRGITGLPENDTVAPAKLRDLIRRCLDGDKNKRPTASEALVELYAMMLAV